jgi:hypothetical protein
LMLSKLVDTDQRLRHSSSSWCDKSLRKSWLDRDFCSYFCPNPLNVHRKCCCPNFVQMPLGYEPLWKQQLWHCCPFFFKS